MGLWKAGEEQMNSKDHQSDADNDKGGGKTQMGNNQKTNTKDRRLTVNMVTETRDHGKAKEITP